MKRESRAPLIVAIVLLLMLLYVGSYFALVLPGGKRIVVPDPSGLLGAGVYTAHYRAYDDKLRKVFWPLEQIDRKLRPSAWLMPWEPAEPRSGRAVRRLSS